ncbi:MAG: HD family phosphohydrolase [Bacteroidota bacterium]
MADEKTRSDSTTFLRHRFSPDLLVKILLAVVLIIALAMMFPQGEALDLDYKVGAVWARKDLIAPFSFPVHRDQEEYNTEIETAKNRAMPVFDYMAQAADEQTAAISHVLGCMHDWAEARRRRGDSVNVNQLSTESGVRFSERDGKIIVSLATRRLAAMETLLLGAMDEYLAAGFIERPKDSLRLPEIAIRRGAIQETVPVDRLLDRKDVIRLLESRLRDAYGGDNDTVELAYKIGISLLKPNIVFNASASDLAIVAEVEAIPRTTGVVEQNERIVSKHERITPETKLKLDSLRKARAERGPESGGAFQFIGIILHVAIVVMLFGIYLHLFRKRIFSNNRRLSLIALLMLFEGLLAYITRELNVAAPIEYLIFVPTAAMLLTIVFDSRVGFYGTVIIAFLVAGIRGNDYSIALASLVAGALSVYTVRDMKNRTQIFRSLGFIFLGYSLSIIALALERFESPGMVLEQLVFALTNAIISPVLTYGLLVFIERSFNVTTDLTLIELSHFNHPLLRQLAERAPGTYHHSMNMASLAESAASAVGGNEVLARVGACFHDIGKINKPTYFVENQRGTRNRHDKLLPRMSSLIIAAHVKDGIALAREHKLPQEVIDFIPMHHGTTRIEYFYSKALKQAESSPDETKIDEIKEQDYRYQGPKPQTKETGILMLADAIEATARCLEDPSPQNLEVVIDELIRRRFEEGELDECPLTLQDLTKIKAAFLGVLVGIYHSRIKYPDTEERERIVADGVSNESRTKKAGQ